MPEPPRRQVAYTHADAQECVSREGLLLPSFVLSLSRAGCVSNGVFLGDFSFFLLFGGVSRRSSSREKELEDETRVFHFSPGGGFTFLWLFMQNAPVFRQMRAVGACQG